MMIDHGWGIKEWDDEQGHHFSADSVESDKAHKEFREAIQPPWWVRVLHRIFRVKYPWASSPPLQEAMDRIPRVVTENQTVHLSGTFNVDGNTQMPSTILEQGSTLTIDGCKL
jgi:hypothetical protein